MSVRPCIAATWVLFGLCAPAAATELPPQSQTWIQVDTEHFTIYSSDLKSRSKWIGKNLEILREVLTRTTQGFRTDSALPTKIYAFKNQRSFAHYSQTSDASDAKLQSAGLFVSTRDGNYVLFDASAGEEPLPTIYHEYVHFVTSNTLPNLPLWLSEGLAEFYSTFGWNSTQAHLGRPVMSHLEGLKRSTTIPLGQLFLMDRHSRDYNEGDRRGTFYAQSWLLTHYLMMLDKGQSLDRLLVALNSGMAPADALHEAIGEDDLGALEKKLESYARKGQFTYFTYTFDEDLAAAEAATRPLERTELLFQLGDLIAHVPPVQVELAEAHFREALKISADHLPSRIGYAALLFGDGRQAAAIEAFENTIAAHPENADAFGVYGLALVRDFFSRPNGGVDAPPQLLKARKLLARSLELAPEVPERLAGFGATFLFEDEGLEPGIAALVRASAQLPTRIDILLDLLRLYIAADLEKPAQLLVDRAVRFRGEPDQIRQAEDLLIQIDLNRTMDLLLAGNRTEATRILRQCIDRAHDAGLKKTLRNRLAAVEGKPARGGSEVDRYNDAVAAANSGQSELAIRLFAQLVANAADGPFKESAQQALLELRTIDKHNRVVEVQNRGADAANAGRFAEAIELIESALALDPDPQQRTDLEQMLEQLQKFAPK